MKKVYLLILVSLVLLLAFTACGNKHEHEFASATCESPAKCSCGETQGEALGHDLTEATCETPATCTRCGAVDGAAAGHTWADATCKAPKTCTTCNKTEGTPAAHKNDVVLNAVPATCSATGLTEGTKCSACGTVTKQQEVVEKLAHTPEVLEAVDPTCSATGLTAGEQCSVCKEVLVAQQTIEKVAHTEVTVPGYAASCSALGLTDGKKCSVCGETTVEQEPIQKLEHTLETLSGYAATCTTSGKTEGQWCTVCEEDTIPQTDIDPLGHDMAKATCTAPATCKREGCGHTEGDALGHNEFGLIGDEAQANCQADGYYVWTVTCLRCKETLSETKITYNSTSNPAKEAGVEGYDDLSVYEKLDHTYTNYVTNNDATCYADGTKTAQCDSCLVLKENYPEYADITVAEDTVTDVGTQRAHKDDDRKCGEPFVCEYEDCDYVDSTPLAHTMVDATCQAYAYCSKCDFVDEAAGYAPCTPGEVVVDPESVVAPTCTVDGKYDNVQYCTVCGKEIEGSRETKVDPAIGHDKVEATCSADAYCQREGCGYVYVGTTRTSHKLDMSYEDGALVYYCATCDDRSFSVDTQKLVFDGATPSSKDFTGSLNKGKYSTETNSDVPAIKTDANGNKYYELNKLNDTTGDGKGNYYTTTEQSQIWLPQHCNTVGKSNAGNYSFFTEFKEGSVGFFGIDLNYGAAERGKLEFFLCEGVPSSGASWYDKSGLGRINDEVIIIKEAKTKTVDGETVKYIEVFGWNDVLLATFDLKADDVFTKHGATGWFNISIGLVIADDYVTAHYYIDGEYVTSQATRLTTENNSITSLYMNGYTAYANSGYRFDNLVFGYTKDAEWIFDACDHANKTSKVTASGCETQGYTTYTCTDCKLVWNDNYTEPNGHSTVNVDAQAPTCIAEGWNAYSYCSVCGDADAAKAAALLEKVAHTLGEATVKNLVAPQCEVEGSYDNYYYCTVCGTYEFEDKRQEGLKIDATGHTEVTVSGKDATCTESGLKDGKKCSVCGKTTLEQEVIPAPGHTEVKIPAVPSTCTVAGKTEGKKCSVCGTVTAEPQDAELAPHDYSEQFGAVTSDKPCATPHTLPGIRCSVCKDVQSEPYAGALVAHTYDDDADTDCNVCGYTRSCLHPNKETVPAVAATCYSKGLTEGEKCADCGDITIAQTETDMIAHTLVEYGAVESTEPCKTASMIAGVKCSVEGCSHIEYAPSAAPLAAHTEVTLAAKAATCTETGLTEGKQCSVCNTITIAQTEIAAKGHTEVVDQAVAPDCTNTGLEAGKHCSVCGTVTVPQNVVPALGHKMAAATCYVPSTCTVCGHTEGEAIANHTINATYKNSVLTYACATCSDVFAPANSVVYDGTNTKYDLSKNGDVTISVVDGAYSVQAGAGADRSQYMLYIPGADNSATFKGFNAENNAFGIVSFELTTNTTEALRFIIMETRYNNGATPWTGRGWDDNSMDLIAITPVTESGKVTKYNIGGSSFTNGTIATVGVDANGMSEKISVQMVMKLTDDMQFMISYYVNGKFCGIYTRDLVNTPLNKEGNILQRLNDGLLEAVHFNGWTAKNTGFTFDNLFIGYTADADWMFDACDHVYGETTTIAPGCTTKGYDEAKCTLCGYGNRTNYVDALNHTATPSCYEAVNCSVCGEKAYDALGHDIKTSYNGKLVYSCERCPNLDVTIDTGYYLDGSNYNGMMGVANNNKTHGYTTDANGLPAIVDGKYVFSKDTTVFADYGQLQIYVPNSQSSNTFTNFTTADNALGVLSFKINAKLDTGMLRFIIRNMAARNSNPRIEPNEFTLFQLNKPNADGTMRIDGWGITELKTITLQDGWTGELDVTIAIELSDDGKMKNYYYINGEFLGTAEGDMPLADGFINALYVTGNSTGAGTGYVLDDLAFGYTTNAHWTFDGQQHNITPSTACNVPESCSCGWVGVGINDHNYAPATCTTPATCTDCGKQTGSTASHKLSSAKVDGKLTYSCATCTNTAFAIDDGFYFDGTSTDGLVKLPANKDNGYTTDANGLPAIVDGKYVFEKDNDVKADKGQVQFYIPHSYTHNYLANFTNASNAVGVISCKFNTNVENGLRFIVRDINGKVAAGSWTGYEFTLFTFNAPSNGTMRIDGWNKTGLKTVTLQNGWTGELDIVVAIELTDDGKMKVYYYINDEFLGTSEGDMPLTSKLINMLYITGNSTADGTGFTLDDMAFGYTANAHWTFNGQEHTVPSGANCVAVCSCGKMSHTSLGHSININPTYDATTGTAVYSCKREGCTYKYEMSGYYYDGTKKDYSDNNTNSPGFMYDGGNATNNSVANGYFDYDVTSAWKESPTSYQSQMWIPGRHSAHATRLEGFTCDNNAEGMLSFKIKFGDGFVDGTPIMLIFGEPRLATGFDWATHTDKNSGTLKITKSGSNVVLKDLNNNVLATVAIPADGWVEFAAKIHLYKSGDSNMIKFDCYFGGEYETTFIKTYNVVSGKLTAVHIKTDLNTDNKGFLLDDISLVYNANGHKTFDGNAHEWIVAEATCGSGRKCSCGWEGKPLAHDSIAPSVVDGKVQYACADCKNVYVLDGSCYSDGENKNHSTINAATEGVHAYVTDGTQASYRGEFWSPRGVETSETTNGFVDFSAANNAVGFLSFDVSAYHNNRMQMQLVGKMNSGAGNWDATNALAATIFNISKPVDNGNGTYTVTAYGLNSSVLKTFTVTSENMFTEMTNFAMRIYFEGDNIVIDYYVGGEYKLTASTACTLTNKTIRTLHTICDTSVTGTESGMYIDNFYFGYTKG